MKFKVMGLNPGYFLKSFLLYIVSRYIIGMVSTKLLEEAQVLFQHEILIACVKIRIIVVLFLDSAH